MTANTDDLKRSTTADAASRPTASRSPKREMPTNIGDALSAIFALFPKTFVAVTGFSLLWVLAYGLLLGAVAGMAVVLDAFSGPLLPLFIAATATIILGVGAYFWTVICKRLDNVYRHGRTGGEYAFAADKTLPVCGSLLLKGAAIAPFAIANWLLVNALEQGMVDGFLVLLIWAIFWLLLMAASSVAYLFVHFAEMTVIIDDAGVLESIKRAVELVDDWRNWLHAAVLVYVVMTVASTVMSAVASVLVIPAVLVTGIGLSQIYLDGFMGSAGALATILGSVLGLYAIAAVAYYPIFAIGNYISYVSARARRRAQK